MDTDTIATLIGVGTLVLTVGGIVAVGVAIARRNARFPVKLVMLEDGFLYHGPLGDARLRWREITSAQARKHTGRAHRRYGRGKDTTLWLLEIATPEQTIEVSELDFEATDLDAFVATLEARVRAENPAFPGITGDLDALRAAVAALRGPADDADDDADDDPVLLRVEARVRALGRPVSEQERQAILMEELRR